MEVPTLQEFTALAQQVDELRREVRLLRGLGGKWMDRKQVATALNCSAGTVDRLRREGKLTCRYEGDRPLFDADVVRAYIQSTCISADVATERVRSASAN